MNFGKSMLSITVLAAMAATASGQTGQEQQSHNSNHQQASKSTQAARSAEKIVTVDQKLIYDQGISVDRLLGADVVDQKGNSVGEVENFVVSGNDNRIIGIIIETGGFLGIGDTQLLYPFDQATIKGTDKIQTHIRKETAGELSLFADVEGEPLNGGRWRVSKVIDGFAYNDGKPYGRVDDVIINKTGNIMAIVVQPDVSFGIDSSYLWPLWRFQDNGISSVPEDEQHTFSTNPYDESALKSASEGSSERSGE